MENRLVFAALGALTGLALGALQCALLRRMLPEDGRLRGGWLLPLKFALWAAAILAGLWVHPVFLLALVGTATLYYIGSAVFVYLRSRKEE